MASSLVLPCAHVCRPLSPRTRKPHCDSRCHHCYRGAGPCCCHCHWCCLVVEVQVRAPAKGKESPWIASTAHADPPLQERCHVQAGSPGIPHLMPAPVLRPPAPCSVPNTPALTEVTKGGQASGAQAGHIGAREMEGSGGQSPLKAHGALCPPKTGHSPQCSLPVGAEQTPLQGKDTKATSPWMLEKNYSCGCPHLQQEETAKSCPNSPALRVPANPPRHPMAKGYPIPSLPCVLTPTHVAALPCGPSPVPGLITKLPSPPLLLELAWGNSGMARAPGMGPPGPQTPSQKHRMVEVGRNLWRPSSPTPLLKYGRLEYAVQGHIQVGFEYLYRKKLHNLSGNLFQCSVTSTVKNFFLIFRWNFVFQFVPLGSLPITGSC